LYGCLARKLYGGKSAKKCMGLGIVGGMSVIEKYCCISVLWVNTGVERPWQAYRVVIQNSP